MIKIFKKYETLICILLIIFYILINMYCIQNFGVTDYRSVIINTLFSLFLLLIIILLKRVKYYGLTKPKNLKKSLYFFPLILLISVNLWSGININNSKVEILFHILTMINIGFIEEIIFRGFLFRMMAQSNLKTAILVTSLTFGIGHIVNLLNGAMFIPTLLQILSAISIGYLFVIIFCKGESIIPCIITHSFINALSIFNIENTLLLYVSSLFIIIVSLIYTTYLKKKIKQNLEVKNEEKL
jgi:membrane protease YdiL (CAAX protease family)